MGLDMYVYRAKKPQVDVSRIYREEELCRLCPGAIIINEEHYNEDSVNDLKPFSVPVTVITQRVNFEKIEKEFGFSNRVYVGAVTPDYVICSDGDKRVQIERLEFDKKYLDDFEQKSYMVELEQVAYWRKAYALQNKIYASFEDQDVFVENCGYYSLSNEQIEMICQDEDGYDFDLRGYEDGELMYHEWY